MMRILRSQYYFIKRESQLAGIVLFLLLCFVQCGHKETTKAEPLFRVLDSKATGIDFRNDLSYSNDFNLFKYIYFYNGSGVAAADFNNDGLIDLFFGSNQGRNKLYLNKGGMQFTDITDAAKIPDDKGWTTGISVVDINNDGWLDIYVCRVGNFETLKSKNLLLINRGVDSKGQPSFSDEAPAYGLDFSGFSTQAAFFDYDLDGDLDMYLMNHSVHQNGTFKPRAEFTSTYHPLSGDRFYRNDKGRFNDITKEAGIQSSAIGYGLGIVVTDVNLDGYPDIYIGNDFHENDYLYINQRNGTFRDECTQRMMHTSQYSMGVDAADINNDGWPEIISVDMLASDPYILKRSLGEDSYDIFQFKIRSGYGYQYTRNNLQVNRRNGMFSETGLYSGIAATDWSWAPLWMDFDNDGAKDLFISNGIPKRMNDIDYINFVSNTEIQQRINTNSLEEKNLALIKKFPQIKLPNRFYSNRGDLSFADQGAAIGGARDTYSNGAAYADLDNDGDLDIVVNNIDDEAMVYENETKGRANAVSLTLQGPLENKQAWGSKVFVFSGSELRTYDNEPVRGFMSSMAGPVLIGLGGKKIDSAFLVWPDNRYQRVKLDSTQKKITCTYKVGLPMFDFNLVTGHIKNNTFKVEDITQQSGLDYLHKENHFVEFDREGLIPHMCSTESPAIAIGDVNKDGRDDIFFGSARNQPSALFVQQPNGRYVPSVQPALDSAYGYEVTAAVWSDVNNDGWQDLVAVNGGNEFYGADSHNTPRVYLNDGTGKLLWKANAFDTLFLTASCVAANDFTGDGIPDLFIGARIVPFDFGRSPRSYFLANDGHGHFTDVTAKYVKPGDASGFVTDAQWIDLDKDGRKDLLCSYEWDTPAVFISKQGMFERKALTDKKGWWNFLLPVDIDGDGDLDLVAGNLGLNSRLKASKEEPLRLYYYDFDNNGKKEQVLSYYLGGRELPFANKAELEKQMPFLKKKFLYAGDFAKAGLEDLLGSDKLRAATHYSADYLANAILVNKGNLQFEMQALPFEAQWTEMRTAVVVQANADDRPDILLLGNYYDNNIEMGRYDADFGTLLLNQGSGRFTTSALNGMVIKGSVRHVLPVHTGNSTSYVIGCNSDSARLIRFLQ